MPWLLVNAGDDDWRAVLQRMAKDVDVLDVAQIEDGSWLVREIDERDRDLDPRARATRDRQRRWRERKKRDARDAYPQADRDARDAGECLDSSISSGSGKRPTDPLRGEGGRSLDIPAATRRDALRDATRDAETRDADDAIRPWEHRGKVPSCPHGYVYDDHGDSPCPDGCRRGPRRP